jgi:integrase
MSHPCPTRGAEVARIKHRQRADGGVSFQVCWVLGGGRASAGVKEQAETFTDLNRAKAFKLDVEHARHQWPAGWVKGGGYVDPDEAQPTGPTVGDVVDRFWPALARRVQRGRLKAYTLHRYKRTWALHLEPFFGGLAFADTTVADVEDWVDTEVDAGSAAKSIRNWHGLLHSIMAYGQQRQQLRADNPCAATELPEVDHKAARQVRFFTDAEWTTFRSALRDDVVLLCDYLLATGLRWGEVSALRVGDLTANGDDEIAAHIVRAWSGRSPDDPDPIDWAAGEAKVWKLGPPKNKRSRYVVVSGGVARRLGEHIAGRGAGEFAFTRRRQPWRYDGFHEDRWKPACKTVATTIPGKRFTPHMLRHTCVVWALAQGARIEQVSEMLGHSSIQITYDIYGGLLDLRDPTVARAMAAAMAGTGRITAGR